MASVAKPGSAPFSFSVGIDGLHGSNAPDASGLTRPNRQARVNYHLPVLRYPLPRLLYEGLLEPRRNRSRALELPFAQLFLAGDHVILHATPAQEWAAGGQDADVDAGPADLARPSPVLALDAAVHHHLEACRLRLGRRIIVAHAELHPDHLDAELVPEGDRFAHHAMCRRGIAEDIDDIDGTGGLGKRRVDPPALDLAAGQAGIDGDDVIALAEQVFHGEGAGPIGGRACANHGNDP